MVEPIKNIKYKRTYGNNRFDEYEINLYNDGSMEISDYDPIYYNEIVFLPKKIVDKLKEMLK